MSEGHTDSEKDPQELKTVVNSKSESRSKDFRLKQLDIGTVANAVFREKWWQIWCVNMLRYVECLF